MKISHRKINASSTIKSAIDTGLDYWYYTRHGMGPGTIPNDVQVLDWYEEGYKTWIKVDKMLTTQELNDYDLKEQFPPADAVTHNGDVIEASCDTIESSCNDIKSCDKVKGRDDANVSIYSMEKADASSHCNKVSEDKDTIHYKVESNENIEARSLINYRNYKIMNGDGFEGWKVYDSDSSLIKDGFISSDDAKEYVDEITSSTDIAAAIDLGAIDIEALKNEISECCIDFLTGPAGGFKRPDEPLEDKWDMYATDIFNVDIYDNRPDNIKIEVRAELDYDSMFDLGQDLDRIIANYDGDAYFEQEEPGIMSAYLDGTDNSIYSSTITGADDLDIINEETIARHTDNVEPPEYDVIETEDLTDSFNFDIEMDIDEDGNWTMQSGDPIYNADSLADFGIEDSKLRNDFYDLLEWHLVVEPGRYIIKGIANMVYSFSNVFDVYELNMSLSNITDLQTIKSGYNEEI